MQFKNIFRQPVYVMIAFALVFAQCSKSPSPDPAPNPPNNGNGNGSGNGAAIFTLQGNGSVCLNSSVNGNYTQGTMLTSSNTVSVQLNVTTIGTWSISTNTVSGFSFSGSGTFTSTGIQSVSLAGSGTPGTSGSQAFTVTAGNSNCTFPITVNNSGNGGGSCDSCGITYIRGIKDTWINTALFDPYSLASNDEQFGATMSLNLTSTGPAVKVMLVNADKGTMVPTEDHYDLIVYIWFSNINNYGSGTNLSNVDTAGKLQLWVYRTDGKDINPAANGKPAINKIVLVPGKINNVLNSGSIILPTYPGNPGNITLSYVQNLFVLPAWKLQTFHRRD